MADFAEEFLYEPLDIEDYSLEFKPDGEADTGGHIHMKPRDMLKFGLLFLNDGKWKGKQIVSSEWISKSTAPNGVVPTRLPNIGYAYLWWTAHWTVGDKEIPAYFAKRRVVNACF